MNQNNIETLNFNENNNINNKPKKKSNKVIAVVITMLIIFMIYNITAKNNDNLLYGKWSCDSNIEIILKKTKEFELYDANNKSNLDIIGSFKVDNVQKDSITKKYTVTMKSNNRTVSGEKLTDDYTTRYEFAIDIENPKKLALINVISYNTYYCTKK